ncbi:transcriptional regulator ATRX homolog isoform X2 [Chironomus tepperi]|uniref:transcriptional regulator ATRX homolog isoform X2 n=1 Tax=Chironomus tepperi TaxID=113505 RepID=UPI00391F1B0A
MMEENLFKDVQVVSVAANEVAPDLVYIDDEEEEPRVPGMTAIKIELREEDPKRSSTPFDSDSDNFMSNIMQPIEEKNQNEQEIVKEPTESFKSCTIGTEFLKTPIEMDDDCSIQDQEQFEIVENVEEKDTSTDSTNDSTRANKSNESNDHSYSQPPPKEPNSFCDDIVKNILQEANLSTSKNAIILLKEYTKFFENLTNEHQHSQLSLYLKQMMFSLNNNEDEILSKPEEVLVETIQNKEVEENCDKSKSENPSSEMVENQEDTEKTAESMKTDELVTSIEMDVSSGDMSIKSDVIQVKQELVETNTGNEVTENKEECKVNGTIVEEADKLKVYVNNAQEKTAEFCENNQKLLDSVFVSEEDVENGNSKFRTSLYNFITFNVALLMAFDNKTDENKTLIEDEINKIKESLAKSRRTSKDNNIEISTDEVAGSSRKSSTDEKTPKSRKSSVSSLDKDLSDSDSDSSVNRLTNLKSLDQRRYETQKSQNVTEKSAKATQKAKKVAKENSDDSSVHSESSESESESPKKIDKSDIENESSEDEELKLKQKLEMKARNNLLASSDDDDDEESYVTSQTEDFSSDDERNDNKVSKKKKKSTKKLESSDEEMSAKEEVSKEPPPIPKVNGDVPQLDISLTKSDESMSDVKENGEDKKSRKRHRKSSFEREIFNKSLLDDSDDESSGHESDKSDGQLATKKMKKGSQSSSKRNSIEATKTTSVVDLTQTINIRAERMPPTLEKYLEKISSTADDQLTAEQPSSSTKVESPKKNDQQKSSKAPSPSLDDIDCISISSESDSEISSTISEGPSRRRKQLTEEELKEETKKAKRDENERVKKLEDKEKRMSQYLTQRLSQSDVIAADELVLDYSEEKELAIVVHETLVGKLKDHQVDGIKFMYNNCYGSVDEVKENNGSGCILAHCMGLGKTLQLIALLHTVTRYPELHTKRILIICPKSTIHNWVEEFRKWLNGLDNKPVVIYLEDNLRIEKRIDKLREWFESKRPSVFLINYESFRILANWSGSHKRSKIALPEETTKKYKQQISKYLLNPGPHIAICDEGHIIKNQKGATNRAITKVTTRRRIILTGTPVQNALHEYYAMVEWIKPNILGTIHEFNNIYANPIKDGQNKDSTDHQIKKMKQKSYVLNKNLSRFVQRKDAQVLKEFLPMKYEYCISIPLTKVQERLYNTCLQANRDDHMGRNLLPIYTALRKIWTHPRVLQYAYERAKKGEHKFGNAQQQQQLQQLKEAKKSQNAFNEEEGDEPDDIFDTSQGTTAVTNNWWNSMLTETDMNSLTSSHKMILLFEILRLCEMKKEKILIFSSFVAVLDIIEGFMKAIHNQETNPNAKLYGLDKYKTTWELGKDYFRLDGSTPRNVRQEMINAFNNSPSPRLRCFLISAKAGGQGINLVAANRCIIIDTSWNPANDNQNIFRIFRLGQKKTCYVYRLVAASTMEERVYSRSVTKEAMSHRVVEKKQIDRHYVRTELEELFVPYELKPQEKTPNFPSDDILRYLLHALPKSAYNFHEHDSLLENKPDQELNEDEKNEAWNSYLAELQGNRHQLQSNNPNANSQLLGAFGKSPISADFMKLYQDMMGTTTNYGNLAGLMPSGSLSGLDSLGLSSTYFPMSSGFYTHDLLKRFGNYDPLNIYSSSLPTSTNIHSTSSTSPLMQQSVLRNSHNPISALGNMAVAATSSYNANNIPPASNSIFAQPVSTSSNNNQSIVPTMMPYSAQTSGSQINKNLPKKKVTDLGYNKKDANKNNPIPTNLSKRSVIMDPIVVPPNSSENLSILPDDQSPPKSIAGTSARTLPKAVNDPKKVEKISLAGKTLNAVKGFTDKILGNQRSLIRPNVIMTKTGDANKNQSNASIVSQKSQSPNVVKTAQGTVIQKPTNSPAQRSLNPQLSDMRKLSSATPWLKPTNNKAIPANKKQNLVTVSPAMKTINRQLVKSPATVKLVNTTKQANTSVNKSQSVVNPNLTSQQKVTNVRTMPLTKQMSPNVSKMMHQQQKRVIDNQTNQNLKRLRIGDSISLSQNSQQIGSQRLSIQQIEPQRSNVQVLTQRPNANQAVLQRVTSQPINSQVIQSVSRVQKPSQQSNKNSTQAQPEVVEVD